MERLTVYTADEAVERWRFMACSHRSDGDLAGAQAFEACAAELDSILEAAREELPESRSFLAVERW